MELAVGTILDGKVTGITKFGAFVALEGGKTGLVHISEISHSYVNDIREHLTEGQEVRAKVIGIDPNGRISLSIKKATEAPPRQAAPRPFPPRHSSGYSPSGQGSRNEPSNFEDKLKQFMQASDSKMSDLNRYIDKKGGSSRRGRRG
jgi:S1 RNA binding domain protein